MTSETFNTAHQLRRLVEEGGISLDALEAITGIPSNTLAPLLEHAGRDAPGLSLTATELSADEDIRLSILASQLSEGFRDDDDFRITAMIEALMTQCRLTAQNIALLTGLELSSIERFASDPAAVPVQTKYQLAVRISYLVNAANAAQA